MMYKVEALNTYEKENIQDNVLGRIPKAGEQWEVDEERLNVLLGENKYKKVFVKKVEEDTEPETEEENTEEVKEEVEETTEPVEEEVKEEVPVEETEKAETKKSTKKK